MGKIACDTDDGNQLFLLRKCIYNKSIANGCNKLEFNYINCLGAEKIDQPSDKGWFV